MNTDVESMTGIKGIAVVYTHFPHYRAPVFTALSRCDRYKFLFFYDPAGIEKTISSGDRVKDHYSLPVIRFGPLMWQKGAISLIFSKEVDAVIFLGNPFIVSTWIAAGLARWLGKPVLYWTHGWLRKPHGVKDWVRQVFYRFADVLLLYGARAKAFGLGAGFDPDRIFVIYNSLDYCAQREARKSVTAPETLVSELIPSKPYFLVVSRLVDSVAIDQAILAMSYLSSDTALVVVGAGPKREQLEKYAIKVGVDVRFAGALYTESELSRFFVGAAAVVSPGKVGLLALHALAYGVPVITHGDLDHQMPEVEVVESGLTGAFFRHGDVVHLSEVMGQVLSWSPDDRERCKNAAIECIERHYTPEAQANYIGEALDSVLKKAG